MKLKTTNELMEELKDKSAFALSWSMLWRMWVLMLGVYVVAGVLGFMFEQNCPK